MAKILLVDDNPQNIELLSLRLAAAGHDTLEAKDGEIALELVASAFPDLMILDMQMPKVDGLQVLQQLHQDRNDIPVVVISAFATVERAVEAMKAGALDFITKPFDPTHLELVVERALERTNLANQNRFLTEELNARYHFVLGHSGVMASAYERMLRAASDEKPALIQGEAGTGKEIAARVIHKESNRSSGPFGIVRCGTFEGAQVAVELFGDTKSKGKVEQAMGGVLFLDEVAKLTTGAQDKLLTLIETHGFTREGTTTIIPADVRILCATTLDLTHAVAEGTFREDLYQLINQHHVNVAPLRDRRDDIPELVNFFVEKQQKELGGQMRGVSNAAMEALTTYHWPGNVRELANILERAVATGRDNQVELADLGIAVREQLSSHGGSQGRTIDGNYNEQLKAARHQIIMGALRAAEGGIGATAELLELSEATLTEMLGELGIRH